MPKEYVNCEDYGREVELADSDGGREKRTLPKVAGCVLWNKDIGNVAVRVVDREKDPDGFDSRSLTLYLDRRGINRMIRMLRQARDDSFGKDE